MSSNFKFQKIKLVPRVLSFWEKRIVLVLFVIIIGVGAWLLYGFYRSKVKFLPADGGTYIEGVIGQPQYINPLLAPTSDVDLDLSSLIFSGLLRYNEKQELAPDLAESYEMSPDQKNYTFHLRKNVKWHDGEEFDADDVIFTVANIKNPEYQSPYSSELQDVAVEKIDNHTIKFTLTKEARASFLAESTTFGISPKHLWEKIPAASAALAELNLKPIGTGPFKFKEYKKDKKTGEIVSYTLSLTDDYFARKPHLQEITFKFYKDASSLITAYNEKEIQGISYLRPEEKNNIKKQKTINIYTPSLSRYYAIFINYAENEILEEKDLRQALAYSLNRKKIVRDGLLGYASQINSPILQSLFGYNPKVKKYNFDRKKANEILDEAGWKDKNKNGVREREGKKLELTLTFPNQNEFPKVAEIIKENFEKIGVKVKLRAVEAALLQTEVIRPRNYEMLLFGQLQTRDSDPYPFWHSNQRQDPGLNLTSFKNKEVDNLLEEARSAKNDEARRKKYFHFQNILAEEVPAIFLYSPQYLYGVNKKIKGIELNFLVSPSDRLAGISNWHINITRQF